MSKNLGKAFEQKFSEDWKKSFPNTFLYRLHDQVTGYKITSQNPCDFLAFHHNQLWMIECKETKENTFNFGKLTQYDRLLVYSDLEDVNTYVIIWFSQHDTVIAVKAKDVERMKSDGLKSINIKTTDRELYNIKVIPSQKKRVFMDSDYSCLTKLKDGE